MLTGRFSSTDRLTRNIFRLLRISRRCSRTVDLPNRARPALSAPFQAAMTSSTMSAAPKTRLARFAGSGLVFGVRHWLAWEVNMYLFLNTHPLTLLCVVLLEPGSPVRTTTIVTRGDA
jgi:hypothetical protein